jgi:ribosomal protein L11 methyltransferase
MTPRIAGWFATFDAPEDVAFRFAEAVERHADSIATIELAGTARWRIEAFSRRPFDRVAVAVAVELTAAAAGVSAPRIRIEQLKETDWVKATQRRFPPFRIGRFFVHGGHWTKAKPASSLSLLIEAATAFGSGEHATTQGCLHAIDLVARSGRRPRRALDLGCGSGILGLAAAKRTRAEVVLADNERLAVWVARDNAAVNRIRPRPQAVVSDGPRHRAIRRRRFDLILANILARPLVRMARGLSQCLNRGGRLIVSGLLARQERQVLAAYRAQRLRLWRRLPIDGWHTLILCR